MPNPATLKAKYRRVTILATVSAGLSTVAFVLVLIAAPAFTWSVPIMASSVVIAAMSAALQYRHYRSLPTGR